MIDKPPAVQQRSTATPATWSGSPRPSGSVWPR